jgi:hypothetical protein
VVDDAGEFARCCRNCLRFPELSCSATEELSSIVFGVMQ